MTRLKRWLRRALAGMGLGLALACVPDPVTPEGGSAGASASGGSAGAAGASASGGSAGADAGPCPGLCAHLAAVPCPVDPTCADQCSALLDADYATLDVSCLMRAMTPAAVEVCGGVCS